MNEQSILGSASERRKHILSELGVSFEIHIPDVSETFHADDPRRTALENARGKHAWCKDRFPARHVITADTIVAFEGQCITKPESMEQAASFLRMFSGKRQLVYTALAMSSPHNPPEVDLVESSVTFRVLSDVVIREFLTKINPLDRAGGYDIDHHGDLIIESYAGSYTNIMGLPRETVAAWLTREGLM